MSIRSMTGFARVSRPVVEGEVVGELTVSIKSVNHRGLDLHFHMPVEFDPVEPAIRAAVRRRVSRGHVQLQVSLKRSADSTSGTAVNEAMMAAWVSSFRELAKRFDLDSKPDLNHALRIPGMLESRAQTPAAEDWAATEALAAVAEALEDLDCFRVTEGKTIEEEIRARAGSIREIVAKMEIIRSRALPYFQQRLRERLSDLLAGAHFDLARIAQEAAILAEKSDISEELVRLRSHADQVDTLLAADGETGKKLDFLLQEMNRETNTILSKTGGLGEQGLNLTDLGLAAKAEIDRIREQSLNIE